MAWYHTFFQGLPQHAWKAAQSEEQTQLDLELLVETLEFGPDDAILDIFCGYGRHAVPLARMGAQVTGVDISEEYIAELQATATAEQLPLRALQGDFLKMPQVQIGPAHSFDAAYCLGNSFSFFPRADMVAFLQRIGAVLKPGARFLAHSEMIAESVLPDYQARNWQPVTNVAGETILFLVDNEYHPLESRIESRLTYVKNKMIEHRVAQHYVYTLAGLLELFNEAGFSILDTYGTLAGDPFELGDEAVWIVAERN